MHIKGGVAKKILKRTNMHVSKEAVEEFRALLEEICADLAAEAFANAKRANRKTVEIEDVLAAKRKMLE